MNRYAKELTAYANGMFAIESLDLLPDIMEGTLSLGDVHKDAIIGILTKCKFLQPHIQEFISSQQIAYFKGELKKSSYDLEDEDDKAQHHTTDERQQGNQLLSSRERSKH